VPATSPAITMAATIIKALFFMLSSFVWYLMVVVFTRLSKSLAKQIYRCLFTGKQSACQNRNKFINALIY
jgi:hypothetical protein